MLRLLDESLIFAYHRFNLRDVVSVQKNASRATNFIFDTLGDVAKVIQGTLQAERQYFDTSKSMIRLWTHECMRVFADRFLKDSADDIGKFIEAMSQVMRDHFEGAEWAEVMENIDDERYGPIFCSFMSETTEILPYEEVADYSQLKQCCEDKLEDYNLEPKLINMNLVLFKDAIRHICRIHRVEGDASTAQRRHYMAKIYSRRRLSLPRSWCRRYPNDA